MKEGLITTSVVAGLAMAVGLASRVDSPDRTQLHAGAIAAALDEHFAELTVYLPSEEDGVVYTTIPVCLVSSTELDVEDINASFEKGLLTAYLFNDCSPPLAEAERLPGCEPFVAPDGGGALGAILTGGCWDSKTCTVAIDTAHSKYSYQVERQGGVWRAHDRQLSVSRNISCDPSFYQAETSSGG